MSFPIQTTQLVRLGVMFPIYCLAYMMAPGSSYGVFMKNPFVKFIAHSSSYISFLFLLAAASQRIERITMHFIGNQVRMSPHQFYSYVIIPTVRKECPFARRTK